MKNAKRIGLCLLLAVSFTACGKKKNGGTSPAQANKPAPQKPGDEASSPSSAIAIVSVDGDQVRLRLPDGSEKQVPSSQVDYGLVGPAILDVYCLKCHQGSGAKGGAPLDGYANASRLASRIFDRIRPGGGMPPSGQQATEAEVKVIEFWIDNKTPEKAEPEAAPSPQPAPSLVSFSQVKTELLDKHCLNCHTGGFASLASREEVKAYIDIARPEQSTIYRLIDDGVMPPSQPLTGEEKSRALTLLRGWIAGGLN